MIKVFLAEDEFVVREGIKNNIDWEKHGYEFCGDASDGELALPLIRKSQPDIVITDIKMPFMDGLSLARIIRKEMPDIEIIILSGYEDFEYAKEGIKIGVAQYLTKPISGEDLIRELDIVAAKIQKKKEEAAIRERYRKEMEENDNEERREMFHKLVSGRYQAQDMLSMAEKLGIDLSASWYGIVLLWIKSEHHAQEEYSGSRVSIEERMSALGKEMGYLEFDRNLEGKAFLFTSDSAEELEQIQNTVIARMKELLDEYSHIRYFGGLGIPVERLSRLNESFESAEQALAHRYFSEYNLFLASTDAKKMEMGNIIDEKFDIKGVDPKQIDRANLLGFLRTGSRDEIPFFIGEYYRRIGADALKSILFRQYIVMDAYFAVTSFIDGISAIDKSEAVPEVSSTVTETVPATIEYLTKIMDKAIEIRESIASNRYSEIVDAAIQYIHEHYSDEDLSLNMLASHVNVSPNHLSAIFSQQTGRTFIKYLTDHRISKAKELLKCTGMRSSEISEEVGYKDPHYFSYMFKKTVGMTPTQFRGGKESEQDE